MTKQEIIDNQLTQIQTLEKITREQKSKIEELKDVAYLKEKIRSLYSSGDKITSYKELYHEFKGANSELKERCRNLNEIILNIITPIQGCPEKRDDCVDC